MIAIVLGTRPEIIKIFPLIKVFIKNKIPFKIIHTGQHYSKKLSKDFLNQLEFPMNKIINLRIGSSNHGNQTSLMISNIENYLLSNNKINCLIVYGDTNSALAGALTASKIPKIKLIHLEAGLRSFDKAMPEEINRRLIDHCSDLLLCPTMIAKKNLLSESISKNKIYITGNTIVDAIKSDITKKNLDLIPKNTNKKKYIVLTIHREENTLDDKNLKKILKEITKISNETECKIIFPAHPKTRKILNKISFDKKIIEITDPMNYFNFLYLIKNSTLVISDSGGVQEEACVLQVPLITIRNSTERPETIKIGCNILSKINTKMVYKHAMKILRRNIKWKNPYGKGNAAIKSYKIIKNFLKKNEAKYY